MKDFRTTISEAKYAKNIEFSKSCIKFFRKMADIVEETEDHIRFRWYEIPEEELPPLEVKISKKGNKYTLVYLKEFGEEITMIKGKQRKGKNKGVGENIKIVKREPKSKKYIKEDEGGLGI